jgi:hypothetical protein
MPDDISSRPDERTGAMLTIDVQPPERRSQMVSTRLSEAEHERLKAAARKRGLHVALVMRQLSLQWADAVLNQDGD